ncbi:outer membrane beta-barrel protein [Zunongwangia endophytica]|uniref:Outer membrane beta-barrel protein n=1 Tax=Zunongwangia endophytica TaxID=1808945 RepID=A0ABV8H893_9FLAO|nr:outer membrane beta-barrel protein [Zunongwangia endophytica]MDN3595369.1 outer membrane beta-barrel protein [Zunongwangia endophytica]
MKFYFVIAFIFISAIGFSQKFELSGKVLDPDGNPLPSATVYVEKVSDSTLVTYTISESSGEFTLAGSSKEKNLNLLISFAGYKSFKKLVEIKEETQNLGDLKMELEDNQLGEVTVVASRPPLTLKKDTLEFNADSFKTRQNANLEELLEKLPGVEVDSDGAITVNGKPVSSIKVNGKEFFGDDPLIATKNLPKEIIEKIQVSNEKTKSEEFTGKAGDPDNKTINITIKEDKNKGYFARATAGGGTDDRYELSAIGNIFKDDMRLSILASSNNINSSGFSFDEVYGMMGGGNARSVFGGGGGITKAENAGLNYTNEWSDKYELNGDYFFGRNDTRQETTIQRENILPDQRFFTNSSNYSDLKNDSHRANARFEIEFDTLTKLSVSPRFTANVGNSERGSSSESLNEDRKLANTTSTTESEDIYSTSFSNNIDFIKRFGNRGAFLQLEFRNTYDVQENDNYFYSERVVYDDNGNDTEIQDQYIDEDGNTENYSFSVSQRSVLADDLFLDLSYDFSSNNNTNERYVFEADQNGDYSVLNEGLSSNFEVKSRQHIPNAGINYEGDVWRIDTNFGLLNTTLENNNYLSDISFDNTYNNLYMRARIRYEVERSKSLSIDYSTDANVPSVRQLQPVIDQTNPNNIVTGNPDLRPSYTHNIRGGYRNFDFSTRSGIFSYFNLNFTENSVVARTITDPNTLLRTTTYTNVDGAMSASLGIFYNKQKKNENSEFRYRLSLNSSYNKNVGFSNGVKFNSENIGIGPSVRFTYAIEDVIEVNPEFGIDYNNSRYSISNLNDQEFINQRAGLEVTTYWPKNVVFGNDISYNKFGNVSSEFDNTSLLWNTSLGYQFWDEKANIKLKVYDVLDQVINTRRVIGEDYIQDTNSLVLTQYAMLSFTYNLKNFGGEGYGGGRGGRRPRR